MNRELLRVENLSVAYGDTQVVKGIDFSLRAGETLALVGESGSGKSQTAHALLRLLPGAARLGGSVRLDGEELLALSPQALLAIRGQRIGMVFQEPMTSLNPLQRIGRQVGEGLRLHRRLRGAALRGRVLELLELAGLEQPRRLLEAYPHQLSGGQRQRVMLAMALACEPQLLIADEPTTALDVTVQKRLLELLQSLQRRLGMAILLISHDLNLVDAWAINSVLRSDSSASRKLGWSLLILLLPVLGLVLWGWTGPRGLRPVTSPEHSK
ncbi:TPA: ATP-binding cassette domain-containing protein [Pseudomonas aeruginosa]|nr:ATP-binding cassette domain-containing protein [Pseudomonas aeruginosa]